MCVRTTQVYAKLLTQAKFREFPKEEIADATRTTEVLTCLSLESRAKVHDAVNTALAAGGTEARAPEDYGFMYGRSFNDLDGHIREIIHMDPSAIKQS